MSNTDLVTWRTLEKEGCGHGRATRETVERMEKAAEKIEQKMDGLTKAAVGAAISLATAAVSYPLFAHTLTPPLLLLGNLAYSG